MIIMTTLSKNEVKYYSSLLQKKFRKTENKFIAEGKKLAAEAFNSSYRIEKIISTHQFFESESDFFSSLKKSNIEIAEIGNKDFEKLSDTVNPQGICAVIVIPEKEPEINPNADVIAALENINDPGNLGTVIRTCDWFGIKQILLSEECADIYNSKVLRSSAGSVFHTKIRRAKEFIHELNYLKNNGFNILCSDITGEDIYAFPKNQKSVLVFSNEANGPSKVLLDASDFKITIPKIGNAESLNVASAAAVIISEFTKHLR